MSNPSFKLISPEQSLRELNKYSKELLSKSKLDSKRLEDVFLQLCLYVKFVSVNEYKELFNEAKTLAKSWPEKDFNEFLDDLDFFALALKENCPIWSKDQLFKKQTKIVVFNTEELKELLV